MLAEPQSSPIFSKMRAYLQNLSQYHYWPYLVAQETLNWSALRRCGFGLNWCKGPISVPTNARSAQIPFNFLQNERLSAKSVSVPLLGLFSSSRNTKSICTPPLWFGLNWYKCPISVPKNVRSAPNPFNFLQNYRLSAKYVSVPLLAPFSSSRNTKSICIPPLCFWVKLV